MAVTEKSGTLKYKDGAGNVTEMYPATKMENVEGLNTALAGKETSGAAAQALADAKTYADSAIQTAIQNTWEANY